MAKLVQIASKITITDPNGEVLDSLDIECPECLNELEVRRDASYEKLKFFCTDKECEFHHTSFSASDLGMGIFD